MNRRGRLGRSGRLGRLGRPGRPGRLSLLVAVCVLIPLVVFSGAAAADPGLTTAQLNATDEPIEFADTLETTDPLENETGTTEVIVRLTPIGEPDAEGDEALTELREHAETEQVAFESFAEDHPEVTIEREFWLANALLIHVDAEEIGTEELLATENVTAVHENIEIRTHAAAQPTVTPTGQSKPIDEVTTPSDEYTPGLELIGAPEAWDRFDTRGAGATVAVIDTGVDPNHQDLDLVAWAEFDENGTVVSDRVADASDPDGHGTHVAGTVAGGDASGTHIGVAPDASLYGMDAFGEDGTATFASVLAAMQRATADDDVDVLQMSLGSDGTFNGFIAPVRNARAAGAVVVAAAGNSGHETSSTPANVYDALAVGAVRDDRAVATFSAGESINKTAAFRDPPAAWPDHYVVPDVTAPGVGVLSAEAGTTDGYVEQQGTSMAAPHVAGVAALAVSATDGEVTDDDLQAAVIDTAVHPNGATEPDDRHGHGVVDAPETVDAAVSAVQPEPEPTETDSSSNDTADDAPGLGVTVALVALAVASLAAVGRGRRP